MKTCRASGLVFRIKLSLELPYSIILSPVLSPASSAGESGVTDKITKFTSRTGIPASFALCTEVGEPDIKPKENKTQAKRKFINTPANKTSACCHFGLLMKLRPLSGPFIFSSSGVSPKIFTNPPKGKRFREYSVSPYRLPNNFGGKPKPNSSTRILKCLATKKCPNSWTSTSTSRIIRKIKILILSLEICHLSFVICHLSQCFFFFSTEKQLQIFIHFIHYFLQFVLAAEFFIFG